MLRPCRSRPGRPGLARAEPVPEPRVGEVVFLGDRHRVGQSVGGLPDDLVSALGRVVRHDRAHHRDDLLAQRGKLVHEGDVDAQRTEPHYFGEQLGTQEADIVQGRGGERLVQDDDAGRRGRPQDPPDPDQVIFELPGHRGEVFLPLEMREEAVGRNRRAAAARDQAADGAQVVELAEGPGEGGLAALVGAGHHDDVLGGVQAEVVRDYGLAPGDELARQGKVESGGGADVRGAGGDLGVAEAQPGRADRPDVVQVCQVELQFPVGTGDSPSRNPACRRQYSSSRANSSGNSLATIAVTWAAMWFIPGCIR